MNYEHCYHAGSFADVVKHATLVALLQALLRKEKPFCYLDTHAGAGRYNLQSPEAQKTREYESGIGRVWQQEHYPPEIADYLSAVKIVAPDYPGSPRIARYFLRESDRMILSELHPETLSSLKREFRHDSQVAIHHLDGYQALKAFLPPKERRGLILIDPPYEESDEIEHLSAALAIALQRFATGIYAIWYPLKNNALVEQLHALLKTHANKPILITELSIYPEDIAISLYGTGMAIINPPWQLDATLRTLFSWLWQTLSPKQLGSHRIKWLSK